MRSLLRNRSLKKLKKARQEKVLTSINLKILFRKKPNNLFLNPFYSFCLGLGSSFNFLKKFQSAKSGSSIQSIPAFSQAIVHLNAYLADPIVNEKTDPLSFWKEYTRCPELRKFAEKLMIIPATSVASERVHSTAGNTITARRSRLDPVLAEKLVFLKENYKFGEKY